MRRKFWLYMLVLAIAVLAVGVVQAQKKATIKPLTEAEARPILMHVAEKLNSSR